MDHKTLRHHIHLKSSVLFKVIYLTELQFNFSLNAAEVK